MCSLKLRDWKCECTRCTSLRATQRSKVRHAQEDQFQLSALQFPTQNSNWEFKKQLFSQSNQRKLKCVTEKKYAKWNKSCEEKNSRLFRTQKLFRVRVSFSFTSLYYALVKTVYVYEPQWLLACVVIKSALLRHYNVGTCADVWPLCPLSSYSCQLRCS